MSLDHPDVPPVVPQEAEPPVRVLAAVIRRGHRYLLGRRPPYKRHGGRWEFPGGKIEVGETSLDAARRELHEELGLEVIGVGERLYLQRDDGSPFLIEFVPVEVQGTPKALEHDEIRWVGAWEGDGLELAPIDRAFWDQYVRTTSGAEE